MKRPALLIFATLLLVLLACNAKAVEIAANYAAGIAGNPATAPSPSTQSWTAGSPTSDVANFSSAAISSDGATGYNAWRMLDNSSAASQFITWNQTLTSTQHASASANGWKLAARLRVVDPVSSNGGSNSVVVLYGNNAAKRWILFFDINAAGQIVTSMSGGSSVTLTGVDPTLYHEHQLVYDATTATAEYLVDGVSKATGYTGTSGAYNGVQWGTGSTAGKGDGYWNSVSFVINDPPIVLAPLATTQPLSQSVATGGSVTLTTVFSGAPTSYQWFKDTVSIGGATNASLTLNSIAPANAGDYWCRATNTAGSASSRSAALSVLTSEGRLVLNEFVAENDGGDRDVDGAQNDWLEIYNSSTVVQSTAGWFLTDDATLPSKWAIPTESIAPGGFLRVWASGKNRTLAAEELHTNFSIKNNGGYLALVKPDLSVATAYDYPPQFADNSYGATVHQPARVKFFTQATPGALNVDGQTSVKDGITFTPVPGTFSNSVSVNATAAAMVAGGTLRYATGGLLPEFDSPAFVADLNLTGTINLRAAVVYPNERYGATASGAWLKLGADVQPFTSPLPVLILSNHGGGAIPGVNARGPNGDGSNVVSVAMQAQSLTIMDAATGDTSMTSPVVNRSRAGLKLRGSSSFTFTEKSYTMETWGERDEEARDVALLDLPADSEWVLYGPDPAQFDNTLIHNAVAYELARQSGFNAPRFRFVELFLNSGGDLTMADHRGLALLVEKPSRGKDRVDFNHTSADGTQGGWMISVDRMDSLPIGSTIGSINPRHFHTAGPDGILQAADDNPRGYQAILTPGGTGSGSGITPANDDMPNFYHSFFNFESPSGWSINPAQRGVIETQVRNFDAALYGANYQDPVNGYWPQIDASNWAHHLLLQSFTKNQDAVVLSSYLYREKPGAVLKWATIWDFDRTFDRNTTNGGTAASNLTWAHDRLFYRRLMTDPEFMQVYIDKWEELRRGPWSNANMNAIVDAQTAQITSTVAARSGLTASAWNANVSTMRTWMTDRANAIDALYTALPVLSHQGGEVPSGFDLTISAPVGTIFYTTDNTDPRQRGSSQSAAAQAYNAPLHITQATFLNVRVKNGSAWSGLLSAAYFPPQDLTTLRATEIYYHPPDQASPFVDGDEFEFFELKNTGVSSMDVSGLSFTAGITYTFPAASVIAPGGFVVLVRNAVQFATRFPTATWQGVYTDKLSNSGEILTLSQGATPVWSFPFGDKAPWRPEADGSGLSLQRPNPKSPGYDVITWTAAPPTPGANLSLADTDADGMADYWQPLHGFVVGVNDGSADADGDGSSNASEFIAGTDPRDNTSCLKLELKPSATGEIRFEFQALAGKSYLVQSSADLQSWPPLQTVPAGPLTHTEEITVTPNPGHRYYRLSTEAP